VGAFEAYLDRDRVADWDISAAPPCVSNSQLKGVERFACVNGIGSPVRDFVGPISFHGRQGHRGC
jgi:hypothetical protein